MTGKPVAGCEKRGKGIFIPSSPGDITRADIARYLRNIEEEIRLDLFSPEEFSLLNDALYKKFFDQSKNPFFLYHFLPLWERAIKIIFRDNPHPKVIELGCGTGTSSLFFALLGAEVIGMDCDAGLIEICNKRKTFYEVYRGPINARFLCADTLTFDFNQHAPIDFFFSLFAFNLMKPCGLLLDHMVPALQNSGKIIIMDGNSSSFYALLAPSRKRPGVISPSAMKEKLNALGCRVQVLETHCAIPSFIIRNPIGGRIAMGIEGVIKALGIHRFFGISYTVVAERI